MLFRANRSFFVSKGAKLQFALGKEQIAHDRSSKKTDFERKSEEQKSKERNSEFPTLPSTPAPITVFLVSSDSDQYFLCCVRPGPYFGSCACGQIFKFGAAKRRGGAWYTWYTLTISSCTQRPAGSIPGTETMAG